PRKLLEFSYQELKLLGSCWNFFRPDSILGQGGFAMSQRVIGSEETAPSKAWARDHSCSQESKPDGLQGHRE
ncbi:hypothetical protein Leryth_024848, partial [Lithospermum erythrorhizon]